MTHLWRGCPCESTMACLALALDREVSQSSQTLPQQLAPLVQAVLLYRSMVNSAQKQLTSLNQGKSR